MNGDARRAKAGAAPGVMLHPPDAGFIAADPVCTDKF
jgi:hypothetical protein